MADTLTPIPKPTPGKPQPRPGLLPPERLESPWGIWIALAAAVVVACAVAIYYRIVFPAPPPADAQVDQVTIGAEDAVFEDEGQTAGGGFMEPDEQEGATAPAARLEVATDSAAPAAIVEQVDARSDSGAAEPAPSVDSTRRLGGLPVLPEDSFGARLLTARTTSGCVSDLGGQGVAEAEVRIEALAQGVLTDTLGCFRLATPAGEHVAVVAAAGFDTLRFDPSRGEAYELTLARPGEGQDARILLRDTQDELDPVAPFAASFSEFETYLDEQLAQRTVDTLIVSFEVSQGGRPRRIDVGPGAYPDRRLKSARKLLSGGPDWPEQYRRADWRYVVRVASGEAGAN